RLLIRLAASIRKAGLRMPLQIIRAHRSLIVSDTVIMALAPDIDPMFETLRFHADERRRVLREKLSARSLLGSAESVLLAVEDGADLTRRADRWVREHAPEVERDLRYGRTIVEQSIVLGLRYLQVGLAAAVLLALVPRTWLPSVTWPQTLVDY